MQFIANGKEFINELGKELLKTLPLIEVIVILSRLYKGRRENCKVGKWKNN